MSPKLIMVIIAMGLLPAGCSKPQQTQDGGQPTATADKTTPAGIEKNQPGKSAGKTLTGGKISPEEVKAFMREMAGAIEKYHLKTDATSPQRGIVYEYVDVKKLGKHPGQWIQGEGLDTMHDGAWYAAAMAQAYLATGDNYYKDFLLRWQMPFYTNMMLHSDTLFSAGLDPDWRNYPPKDNKFGREWRYMGRKGWVPYWWDDGASVSSDMIFKGRHGHSNVDYLMVFKEANPENRLVGFSLGCSNHMAQDLGVMLMRTWLLLRDPAIAESAKLMQLERTERGYKAVPAILAPAAITNQSKTWMNAVPKLYSEYPTGDWLFKNLRWGERPDAPEAVNSYVDEEAYYWNSQMVKFAGKMTPELASALLYRVWGFWVTNDYWYDVSGPIPGVNNLDLRWRAMKNNKFVKYQSDDAKMPDGSRGGCQNLVYTAVGLQLLREFPGSWERIAGQKTPDSLRVYFTDDKIALDGQAERAYGPAVKLGDLSLRFVSDAWNLYIQGQASGTQAEFTLLSDRTNDAIPVKIVVTDGAAKAALADGKEVLHEVKTTKTASGLAFELKIPYTIKKEQTPWANAVETGYLAVKVGEMKKDLFFLSSEERIRRQFLNKIEGGIVVWREVFKKLGYIPTGFLYYPEITGSWGSGDWLEEKADSGGYAHLITACAQYLLYATGRNDWEVSNIPTELR